jgi:hypothetical protein
MKDGYIPSALNHLTVIANASQIIYPSLLPPNSSFHLFARKSFFSHDLMSVGQQSPTRNCLLELKPHLLRRINVERTPMRRTRH